MNVPLRIRRPSGAAFVAPVALALLVTGAVLPERALALVDFGSLPLNTWVREPRPSPPAPVDNSGWLGMAYSPDLDRALLLGLNSTADGSWPPGSIGYANDVWLFEPGRNRWTLQHPTDPWGGPWDPNVPAPRHTYNMITYDSRRLVFYVYGGDNRNATYNDLWKFDFQANRWTRLIATQPCPGTPPIYWGGTLTYDPVRDAVFLISGAGSGFCSGGMSNATWMYSPTQNRWTNAAPPSPPSERWGAAAAFDSRRNRIWFFGASGSYGEIARNDLWSYDPGTNRWQMHTNGVGPSPRGESSMAYDSVNDILLVFGGRVSVEHGQLNDTWIYNVGSGTWTQVSVPTRPTNVSLDDVLEYDPNRNVFLLFSSDGMWYFRRGGSLPSDTTPPAAIRDLSTTP